jgi:hypothetical protein
VTAVLSVLSQQETVVTAVLWQYHGTTRPIVTAVLSVFIESFATARVVYFKQDPTKRETPSLYAILPRVFRSTIVRGAEIESRNVTAKF